MGINKFGFNPITGHLDLVEQDIIVVSSAPITGIEGVFYQISSDPTKVYYFSGGNRYLITGVLDNPVSGGGWLSLAISLFD